MEMHFMIILKLEFKQILEIFCPCFERNYVKEEANLMSYHGWTFLWFVNRWAEHESNGED